MTRHLPRSLSTTCCFRHPTCGVCILNYLLQPSREYNRSVARREEKEKNVKNRRNLFISTNCSQRSDKSSYFSPSYFHSLTSCSRYLISSSRIRIFRILFSKNTAASSINIARLLGGIEEKFP